MRRAYEALLGMYPAFYREVFGHEMTAFFEQAQADRSSRGPFEYCTFLLAEMAGLIAGAFSAWSEEYISRPREKLVFSYWFSIAGGVAITVFFQGFFLRLWFLCFGSVGVLLFLSLFSLAFVWNMRIVGNQAGRLKPIWMPGGERWGGPCSAAKSPPPSIALSNLP